MQTTDTRIRHKNISNPFAKTLVNCPPAHNTKLYTHALLHSVETGLPRVYGLLSFPPHRPSSLRPVTRAYAESEYLVRETPLVAFPVGRRQRHRDDAIASGLERNVKKTTGRKKTDRPTRLLPVLRAFGGFVFCCFAVVRTAKTANGKTITLSCRRRTMTTSAGTGFFVRSSRGDVRTDGSPLRSPTVSSATRGNNNKTTI